MILLFGGTTEAKEVAGWLERAGLPYIYSTKTKVQFEGRGKYRYGALDAGQLEQFCKEQKISCIINACHPFAAELHTTVASLDLPIPLIRFERLFPERRDHPLVKYVDGYQEALKQLEKQGSTSLLVLSGVQSIPCLKSFWTKNTCWFRILDRPESRELAAAHGFPEENLLFGFPQDREEEALLFRTLNPDAILTKESGYNGKLQDKIEAALVCQVPIYILKKPELPSCYKLAHSKEELLAHLPIE